MGVILQGELSTADGLIGELSALDTLSGSLSSSIIYDPYTGSYDIKPKFTAQVLETQDKLMEQDLVVDAIYVSETTNPQGGLTVYIGGEFING